MQFCELPNYPTCTNVLRRAGDRRGAKGCRAPDSRRSPFWHAARAGDEVPYPWHPRHASGRNAPLGGHKGEVVPLLRKHFLRRPHLRPARPADPVSSQLRRIVAVVTSRALRVRPRFVAYTRAARLADVHVHRPVRAHRPLRRGCHK